MFNTSKFDQPIGSWNVSSVTNMESMFANAQFNQAIGDWDVSSVSVMNMMFSQNLVFNQILTNWCVALIPTEPAGFSANAPINPIFKPIWGTCGGTSVEKDGYAHQVALSQNYPNPFNPSTQIQFSLPSATHVRLEVFSATGQLVATLVNDMVGMGFHSVSFDGKSLASGVYVYRLSTPEFTQTRLMNLVK
jgi:hypothetical protein